ncbi:imelysin family protein [Myroides sp. N17-2]|uniref:imelysin family protein n=1 Tax=Myroides sp. N17-2 TaxID=2030799 RepID=UPI000EFC0152|nr:imelysin family protein [Myroides sp. N17-2]
MRNKFLTLGLVTMSFIMANCSNNDDTNTIDDSKDKFHTSVITDLTGNVIIETYKDLNNKAIALDKAINTFNTTPTQQNLELAKKAWVDTRKPWELSEGFLYGPVEDNGIDPAMDTWPVDVEAMNNILKSNLPITPALINSNNEARGFHLIEFLLWGEDGTKKADQITARQKEYLKAASEDLQNNTKLLYNEWKTDGGNYAAVFNTAGMGSKKYPSRIAALEEIVEGLITISDEVASGKIEDPLNSEGSVPYPEKEESRFSNNSKEDFIDNIRGIENIYLGKYDKSAQGLSTIVAEKNKALDNEVKAAITDAIKAIDDIPGTFTQAIYSNRPQVIKAQNSVNELTKLLKSKLKPFVNSL